MATMLVNRITIPIKSTWFSPQWRITSSSILTLKLYPSAPKHPFTQPWRCYSSSKDSKPSSSPTQQTQAPSNTNPVKKSWRFVVSVVKSFSQGARELFSDVKKARQLKRVMGEVKISGTAPSVSPPPISWQELRFMYKTMADLKKMLPTLAFFFIPLLGYFAPFVAYFVFPRYMLSEKFWTEEQKNKYRAASLEERSLSLSQLASKISRDSPHQINKEFHEVLTRIEEQLAVEGTAPHEWSWLLEHRNTLKLNVLPSQHLSDLMGAWGVSSVIPLGWWKRRQFQRHIAYIYTVDWFKQSSPSLSKEELHRYCEERCLLQSLGEPDLDKFQADWRSITTSFKECPAAIIAHLPLVWYHKHEPTDH